jgi:hypothetical protein
MDRPGCYSRSAEGRNQDTPPTLVAAAGDPDIVEKVKQGHQAGTKTFNIHLDGDNLIPFGRVR